MKKEKEENIQLFKTIINRLILMRDLRIFPNSQVFESQLHLQTIGSDSTELGDTVTSTIYVSLPSPHLRLLKHKPHLASRFGSFFLPL
jgi:hypothetical protein